MKNKNIIGTVITMIFAVAGILLVGLTMSAGNNASVIVNVAELVTFVVIIAYMLWDYKVPHSNIYKYVMLIFALSLCALVNFYTVKGKAGIAVLYSVAMVLIGYMSGRLGKIKKNGAIMVIVFLVLALILVLEIVSFPSAEELAELGETALSYVVRAVEGLITWIALCSGYCTRFAEHKAAGETEDNKG